MLVQCPPPSRVTWTRPSSVPAQSKPRFRVDGAIAVIVVKLSAPPASGVRPPLPAWRCHSGLFVVRSGLMTRQLSPRSVERWTNWLPA